MWIRMKRSKKSNAKTSMSWDHCQNSGYLYKMLNNRAKSGKGICGTTHSPASSSKKFNDLPQKIQDPLNCTPEQSKDILREEAELLQQ